MADLSDRLQHGTSLPELVSFLHDELGWPVGVDGLQEDTFDYGLDEPGMAARRVVTVRLWHPVTPTPPWGICFLELGAQPLSLVALRSLLRALVTQKRQTAGEASRRVWNLEDLLLVCSHCDEGQRIVTFVRLSQPPGWGPAARLTSFAWTEKSHNHMVRHFLLPALRWPADAADAAGWREQWSRTFDKRRLTEVFWREYHALFEVLQTDFAAQTNDAVWAHDYTLQFLHRCLSLCLVQRQRWLSNDPDFLRTFWSAYAAARQEKNTFCERWLKVLFFEVFPGRYPGGRTQFPDAIETALRLVPSLNGGPFEENDLDRRYEFLLRDELFLQVLRFLERYDFTTGEDTSLEEEVAVDAEMLGRVHENLVNLSEHPGTRGAAGVFYTPRTEIDLMCRLALVDHLANHLGAAHKGLFYETVFACGSDEKHDADSRLQRENLWTELDFLLRRVTVLDPACGSGSFLVGMLQVLDDLAERANRALGRLEKSYERRRRIIGQSLYGMDVMPWAVEMAELRLGLQLALEIDRPPVDRKCRPWLPDLSCNLRCGDSLIREGSPSWAGAPAQDGENRRVASSRPQTWGMTDAGIAHGRESGINPAPVREPPKVADPLWGRRFEIVIGNPPYVRHEKIHDPCLSRTRITTENKRQYKARLAASLYRAYPSFFGCRTGRGSVSRRLNARSDLYVYFFLQGLTLLNERGTLCFLTSNSWLDVAYGADLQEFLLRQCHVKMILDNEARRSFASADVNTVITLLSPPGGHRDWARERTARFVTFRVPFERTLSAAVFQGIEAASARRATAEYRVFPIRQDRLLQDGCERTEDENARVSSMRIGDCPSAPRRAPARYIGSKWGGKFLRAPDVFHRVREMAGRRLVPLGRLGKVRYPIKTGINDFFYLEEDRIAEFGIDRKFLVRVVKSPREFRSIRLREDDVSRFLFSCPLSLADLAARGCSGTLAYIRWGARQKTVARQKSPAGVPWPQVPSVQGRPQWYSIAPLAPADVVCNRFFHDRFFFGFADFPVVEDQTFYGCTFTIPETCRRAQIALLNSTLQFLFVELLGRIALGEGVLQYATYEMAQMLTIDARELTESQRGRIVCAFAPLAERPLARAEQEMASCDRRRFDDCVFDVLGLTPSARAEVYEAVIHLVDARLTKAASLCRRAAER